MEKHISGLLVVIAVFALLIGGLVGYNMAPVMIETETETVIEYQNVSVDRFVDVPTADISLYILPAVEDFLDELDDADDLECGNDEYSLSEVSIDRDYTHYPYSVTIDEDSDGDVTEVGFESRLEFDEDDEKSCKKHYEVLVTYEVGEDTEFEY